MREQLSKWPSTHVWILDCSGPQWCYGVGKEEIFVFSFPGSVGGTLHVIFSITYKNDATTDYVNDTLENDF